MIVYKCDICGCSANPEIFELPAYKKTRGKGVSLAPIEATISSRINICADCRALIASYIESIKPTNES